MHKEQCYRGMLSAILSRPMGSMGNLTYAALLELLSSEHEGSIRCHPELARAMLKDSLSVAGYGLGAQNDDTSDTRETGRLVYSSMIGGDNDIQSKIRV